MPRTVEEILASYQRPVDFDIERRMNGVMQLDIIGDGGGTFYLHVNDGKVFVQKGRHEAPAATVSVEVDDFLSMVRGTSTVFELAMRGKLRVTGSLQLANRFRSMLLDRV